jgi:hypothetical protein
MFIPPVAPKLKVVLFKDFEACPPYGLVDGVGAVTKSVNTLESSAFDGEKSDQNWAAGNTISRAIKPC